ncbi:MAG: hypothetical protein ACTSVI_16910 [Promethearchaeota archaeon]
MISPLYVKFFREVMLVAWRCRSPESRHAYQPPINFSIVGEILMMITDLFYHSIRVKINDRR